MRLTDTLSLSVRMFRTRPMRTMLTILGVSLGIAAVLFLVSLGYGLQETILERIATADMLLAIDVRPSSDAVTMDDDAIAMFLTIDGVESVAREQQLSAEAALDGLHSGMPVSAIDPAFVRLSGMKTKWGRTLTPNHVNAVLLTSASAPLFGIAPAELLDQDLLLTFRSEDTGTGAIRSQSGSYAIIGILENDAESRAFVPLISLTDTQTKRTYDLAKVKVRTYEALEPVRAALIARGYVVSSVSDVIEQANRVFRIVQILLGLFGLVALVVSAIGMFNTMTITLLERTNEIGIMRAIGMTPRDIRTIFLAESMLMGCLGGALGIGIGWGAGRIVNLAINTLAVNFGGSPMMLFDAPAWFVIFVLVFSALIGLLTGIYPSIRASRLNPLDALRYK